MNILNITTTQEAVKRIVTTSESVVAWRLTIRLDAMFEAVQLPPGIAHLDARLTNMNTSFIIEELCMFCQMFVISINLFMLMFHTKLF